MCNLNMNKFCVRMCGGGKTREEENRVPYIRLTAIALIRKR